MDEFKEGFLETEESAPVAEKESVPQEHQVEMSEPAIPPAEEIATVQPAREPTEESEPELPEDVKELFEDYPEYRKAIEFEAEKLFKKKLGGVDPQDLEHQLGLERFVREVTTGTYENGVFIEGHPDAQKVTNSQEYWDWWKSKGYQPCDSKTAIQRISEFKRRKPIVRSTPKRNVNADDFSEAYNS